MGRRLRLSRVQPARWAARLQRLSGVALAVFLPLHFVLLASALHGERALDEALAWTRSPWVVAAQILLIAAFALHILGGVRLLLIEFLDWYPFEKRLLILAGGLAVLTVVSFSWRSLS